MPLGVDGPVDPAYRRSSMPSRPRALSPLLVGAVAAAAAAALIWRVVSEPADFGYVRYLGIADDMARSGDWVVMRLEDKVYLHKPPLFIWLLALPISLLGEAPGWVAHLPDLLALAVSLLCVHRLAAAIYGRGEPALAAVLIFATTWETFNQSTGKRLDPLFAALLTAAFTLLYLGATAAPRSRLPRLLAAWALVALATLAKGPLAILLFVVVTAAWAGWTGRLRSVLLSASSAAGVALLLGLTLPWPAALVHSIGMDETLRLLRETNLTTRTGSIFHYVRSLPVQDLPWSLFLPALGVWLWKRRDFGRSDGMRFLLVWFLAIFALVHLSEARHQRYLQPATPALTLLLLSLWYEPGGGAATVSGGARRLRDWISGLWLGLLAIAGGVGAAGLWALEREPILGLPVPAERWLAAPVALAIGACAVLGLRSLWRGGLARTSPVPLALLFLGVLTIFSLIGAGDIRRQDDLPGARTALGVVSQGRPAALLGLYEEQHQMARILTRRSLPILATPEDVARWAGQQPAGGAFVITDAAGARGLADLPQLEILSLQDLRLAQEAVALVEVRSRAQTGAPLPGAGP